MNADKFKEKSSRQKQLYGEQIANYQMTMVLHGAIVAFIGSLSGVVYTFVLTGAILGSIKAWHLAHLQGVMTGMLIMAVSSFVSRINLTGKHRFFLMASYITTGYCYAFGPIWGAVFRVRGIEPAAPAANMVMYLSNTIASVSILIGLGLTIYGCSSHGSNGGHVQ